LCPQFRKAEPRGNRRSAKSRLGRQADLGRAGPTRRHQRTRHRTRRGPGRRDPATWSHRHEGYHGNPTATTQIIRDGWLSTGDLGYVDDDGYYFIVDRIKDLIIRAGQNVVAVVVARTGAAIDPAEVIAYCWARLTPYKRPREVHVRAELPKTASGKILKRNLTI
jgi:acyl-coenzyme A synthetase/AMP-(fatty) acid ligase